MSGVALVFKAGDRIAQPEGAVAGRSQFEFEARKVPSWRPRYAARHRGRHPPRRAAAPRQSTRHRSSSYGCGDRCRGRSRRCPADRDRQSARRSPMAARAVPRLMAVVVLPTPPFLIGQRQDTRMARRGRRLIFLINMINYGHALTPWVAVDGLRRSIQSSSTIQPCPAGAAGMEMRLDIPIFSGFGQFCLYILAFEK